MKVDLSKYKEDWYKDDPAKNIFPGPVVTISREIGCPAKVISARLTEKLNEIKSSRAKDQPWKWISKEILHESAKKLKVDEDQIEHIFNYKSRGVLEDLFLNMSKDYYKSDMKIKNTIARVIRSIANNGNVVIVGRGGVAITRDIERSLHIHLEAPLEWRAVRVAAKHYLSLEQAKDYAHSIDKKRAQFRDQFQGKGTDYTWFDLKINCMTIDVNDAVSIIIASLKARKII